MGLETKTRHYALKHGPKHFKKMDEWEQDILNLDDEGDTGYFFKVDMEYPQYLHKTHDQFPLAPQHLKIEENLLSSYQKAWCKIRWRKAMLDFK